MTDLPIVCTLTEAQLRQRQESVLSQIRTEIHEEKELEDGYAFRFTADDTTLDRLVPMVNLERKCCQFLRFRLTVETGNEFVWLEITGLPETKIFVKDTFAFADKSLIADVD